MTFNLFIFIFQVNDLKNCVRKRNIAMSIPDSEQYGKNGGKKFNYPLIYVFNIIFLRRASSLNN